jgi:hypothetical protein
VGRTSPNSARKPKRKRKAAATEDWTSLGAILAEVEVEFDYFNDDNNDDVCW